MNGNRGRVEAHARHALAECVEHAVEQARMRGDVDVQAAAFDAARRPAAVPVRRSTSSETGGDAQVGRVDGGDVELQALHQLRAVRLPADRPTACRRPARLRTAGRAAPRWPAHRQRHHAGQAGRRVFAGAVADDGGGLHAPALPQLGQRVFEREQRGHRVAGPLQRALQPAASCAIALEHHGAQVARRIGRHQREAFVHRLRERGLRAAARGPRRDSARRRRGTSTPRRARSPAPWP